VHVVAAPDGRVVSSAHLPGRAGDVDPEPEPRVLILDEPTRGIDVGAKTDVHHIVDDLARSGIAVILISSDLPEVLAMSDRVLVMREGRSMGIFSRAEATQERIMTAAVGVA
jgi:rhamnose transport system ATP-binding protein